MSYKEETRTKDCPSCGATNHLIVAYAGDYSANERERANCYRCGQVVDSEDCFVIYASDTEENAIASLRQVQNRT